MRLIREDRFKLPTNVKLHDYSLGNETSVLLLEFPNGRLCSCVYQHATDQIIKIQQQGHREIDFSLGQDLPMILETDTPYGSETEPDLFPAVKMPSFGAQPFRLK